MGRGQGQLTRLATDLGPRRRRVGHIGVPVHRQRRQCDGRQRRQAAQTLAQLSGVGRILADGSGNIVDIIKNLQTFITRAARQQRTDRAVPGPVRHADQRARRQQVRPGRGTDQPVRRRRRRPAVRRGQPRPDRRAGPAADQRHPEPRRPPDRSRERPARRAERVRQRLQHLQPGHAAIVGPFALNNFSNPMQFICGAIGAVENTTAAETSKLCAQYLGPALRLLNFNYLPFPVNPFLMPSPPRTTSSTPNRRWLPAERARPRAARDPARGVGVHRSATTTVPPPPGFGPPPASRRVRRRPTTCLPSRRPRCSRAPTRPVRRRACRMLLPAEAPPP